MAGIQSVLKLDYYSLKKRVDQPFARPTVRGKHQVSAVSFVELPTAPSAYLAQSVLDAVVVKDRQQLLFDDRYRYFAFADLSGGRSDDAALAIAHGEDGRIIVDSCERLKAPFNPSDVIAAMAQRLDTYRIPWVMGDNYAASFVSGGFKQQQTKYRRCKESKNVLYAELIPRITSKKIDLLDIPLLIHQFANLERKARSGGRDIIDHPHGGHDDWANVIAGVC